MICGKQLAASSSRTTAGKRTAARITRNEVFVREKRIVARAHGCHFFGMIVIQDLDVGRVVFDEHFAAVGAIKCLNGHQPLVLGLNGLIARPFLAHDAAIDGAANHLLQPLDGQRNSARRADDLFMRPVPSVMYIRPVAYRIDPIDDFLVGMRASRPQIEHFKKEFGSFGVGYLYDLLFPGDENLFVLIAVCCLPDFESLICQFDFAADHPRQDVRDFGFGGVGDHRLGNLAR